MKLVYEPRIWKFRGEEYEYIHTAYRCEDTGEQFTTGETDDAGFIQVTNQYRAKYGIPYTDEIVAIRERYGISASKMSAILGIGTNQWRLYEAGEVPSVSNGRMIRSIANPKVFLDLVECAHKMLPDKEYFKITEKIRSVIEHSADFLTEQYECKRVFNSTRGMENGYSATSLTRLKAILLTVLQECGEVFCTKMNKLLFYIDFLSYRQRGMAMTGLAYHAYEFGPVPDRWDKVYSEFEEIRQKSVPIGEYEGTVLVSDSKPDDSVLSRSEKEIINTVCSLFKYTTSRDITAISHEEPAWQAHQEARSEIPYSEAFTLKAL
ncbi:MAG: DUF4065 domain-containing protein [Bacteroidales bacterium]|nr:DUF4065 domain-containing protein [Candidatus Cryptobacteroides aphodequi]